MKILLTGFEPFLKWTVNPSAEVVAALAAAPPEGVSLLTRVLPVSFEAAGPLLRRTIDEAAPEVVLLLGQGGGPALRLERIGVNLNDIPGIQDNRGRSPEEEAIDPGAPAAYWSTLPVRRLVGHLRAHGVPAVESLSAGTFLCNHVLYSALHHCAGREFVPGLSTRCGFVHLPPLPEQVATDSGSGARGRELAASMSLETQVAGVRLILEFLAA